MTTATRNHAPARAAPSSDRYGYHRTGIEAGHASAEEMRTQLTHVLALVGRPR